MRHLYAFLVLFGLVGSWPLHAGQAPAQPPGTLTGVVVGADGAPQAGAVVRLQGTMTPPAEPATTPSQPAAAPTRVYRAELTNGRGEYAFKDLLPIRYDIEVHGPGAWFPGPGRVVDIPSGGQVVLHLWSASSRPIGIAFTAAAALVFLILLLLFRTHNIAAPARALLEAQLDSIAVCLELEVDAQSPAHVKVLEKRLEELRTQVRETRPELLFWSRGREIAAWVRSHEIERQLVAFLVPDTRVIERAYMAEAQLRTMTTSTAAIVLADRIRSTLATLAGCTAGDAAWPGAMNVLKQQLAEALATLYDARDTMFAGLMEWQNKAMFMVCLGLLVIVVVAFALGHPELFLIGAVGGLMSRMARSLFREDVASDYGASWTTLFLSPVIGAVSAWFGVALMVTLTDLGVLGDVFRRIAWEPPQYDAFVIGLAFTLGFSERLFRSLLAKAEGQVVADPNAAKAGAGAAAAAPIVPQPIAAPPGTGDGGENSPGTIAAGIVADLDVTAGEDVAFIGDASSPSRQRLATLGAGKVVDVTVAQLSTVGTLDAVLIETPIAFGEAGAVASAIASALDPAGRVVVVATIAAGLFDADLAKLEAEQQVGPAVVRDRMTRAGLLSQEPPERLSGPDPVRWSMAFVKPSSAQATGGGQ